jgi:hypothetical protein
MESSAHIMDRGEVAKKVRLRQPPSMALTYANNATPGTAPQVTFHRGHGCGLIRRGK